MIKIHSRANFHLQGALYCEQLTDVLTEMPNCYRNNTLQDNSSRRTIHITKTSNAENMYCMTLAAIITVIASLTNCWHCLWWLWPCRNCYSFDVAMAGIGADEATSAVAPQFKALRILLLAIYFLDAVALKFKNPSGTMWLLFTLLLILLAIHKYIKLFWLNSRWTGWGEGHNDPLLNCSCCM